MRFLARNLKEVFGPSWASARQPPRLRRAGYTLPSFPAPVRALLPTLLRKLVSTMFPGGSYSFRWRRVLCHWTPLVLLPRRIHLPEELRTAGSEPTALTYCSGCQISPNGFAYQEAKCTLSFSAWRRISPSDTPYFPLLRLPTVSCEPESTPSARPSAREA